MPNAIAFFPWLSIKEPVTTGGIRLLPYRRRLDPGNTSTLLQSDVDAILAAYAYRKSRLVDRATLLELDTWSAGQDLSEEVAEELFRAREFLAFSSIANRKLFGREQYCNFDTFLLIVQRYEAAKAGSFSFFVRRRDGGVNHLWHSKEFAFLKPPHVEAKAELFFDRSLFEALRLADAKGEAPLAAITEFNRANTDSDIPLHVELVLLKSAFEFLFGIDQRVDRFVASLLPLIPKFTPTEEFKCLEFEQWEARFPNSKRPLEAWAREFCIQRNEAGHGARREGTHHVWTQRAHLAFASMLMPTLVKLQLIQRGFATLTEDEAIQLAWVEAYLGFNPDEAAPRGAYREHSWLRIYDEGVSGERRRRTLRGALKEIWGLESDPSK